MSFESAVKKGREGKYSGSSFDKAVETGRSNMNYGVDDDYIKSYSDYYTKSFGNAKSDYDSIGFDNAKAKYDSYASSAAELNRMGDRINAYMRSNRSNIDDDTYKRVYDMVNSSKQSASDITKSFRSQKDYYSQWASQEDYDSYQKAMERNKYLSEMDLDAAQKEIDRLQNASDSASKYDNAYNAMLRTGLSKDEADARAKEMTGLTTDSYGYATEAGYGSLSDLMNDLSGKKKELYEAKAIQNRANLESVKNAPDFAEMSARGASVKNPSVREASGINLVGNVRLGATPVENIVTYTRDNKDYIDSELRQGRTNFVGDTKYNLMTDDEVSIYNYYIGRGDKESASAYLDSIYDELTRREAYGNFENINDNKALELAFSIVAGGDQVANAFKGMSAAMKGEDYVQASTDAYVGQMVRDDLNQNNKFLRFMYDTLSTTTAQVPAIALGGVFGAGVGAAALGMSAMGNTYAEKVNEGYDRDKALTYAAIDGATEVLMEKFLGAMPNIGGKAMDKVASSESVKRASSALKKILPKFAKEHSDDFIKFFGSMASEFREEALQEAIAPVIENAVFGENTNETTMGEILYAGLLGAMSAGLMNGVGLATGYAGYKSAEADSYRAGQNYIMDYAKEAPEGSEARAIYDKVQQKIEDGGNASVKDLKNLDKANATARISKSGKTELNGKEVEISRVESVGKDGTKLRLKDGSVVDAKNLMYENDAKSVLYNSLASTKMSANALNYAINAYDGSVDPQKYVRGAYEAYTYGYSGVSEEHRNGSFYKELPQNIREALEQTARSEYEEIQKAKESRPVNDVVTGGKIIYDTNEKIDRKKLSTTQRVSLDLAGVLSKVLNVPIHVYESVLNDKGERVYSKTIEGTDAVAGNLAANGWHRTGTGEIYVDLNAGQHGEGTMVYTIAHELTHNMREMAVEAYNKLKTAIAEEIGASGGDLAKMVQRDIERNPQRYEGKSYDVAEEEFIARTMEGMLSDTNAVEQIERLRAKDGGLIDKIRAALRKVVNAMKAIYKQYKPESAEAQYILKEINNLDRIVNLYAEGVAEAANVRDGISSTKAEINKSLENAGIVVDDSTNSASMNSVRYLLEDDQKNKKKAIKLLMSRFGVTAEEASGWIDAETSLASLILNPKYSKYLDYEGDDSEVAIKQNSDYPQGTVDFSPICAKRREFTQIMNSIMRNFANHVFKATDLAKIRTIMQEEGITVPCGICYVEDRRQLDTIVANYFIDSIKNYRNGKDVRPDNGKPHNENQRKALDTIKNDSYIPSVYELITLEGMNKLREKSPKTLEAWKTYNNARGMQDVRLLANEAEYKRQILSYSKSTVDSKNNKGGLRIYSFSDMEMFHLIDIVQVLTDCAAVGLKVQGYTKVNEYAYIVRNTGEKLNRSLIPLGDIGYHMEGDRVVLDFDTVEGIDINSKYFFDNKKYDNIGNIVIGINDTQIKAAMESDFIDQIIPFHTGQSGDVLAEKGIGKWDNYKDYQTDKDAATGKTADKQINIYTDVLNVLESEGKEITKVSFVNKFLEVCKERGLTPRFSQFLNKNKNGDFIYTEGYHKLLVDFKTFKQTKKGEYLPQNTITPNFDNAEMTKIMKQYVKDQQVKDNELSKGMPKVIDRITNEIIKSDDTMHSDRDVYDSIAEEVASLYSDIDWYDYSDNLTGDETAHLADQLRNGDYSVIDNIMDFYDDADDELQKKADKVIERINSLKTDSISMHSDRDSSGRKLSSEQVEFFRDSKARDDEGKLLTLYSGTSNGGFNEFRQGKIWMTTVYDSARAYGGASDGVKYAPSKDSKEETKEYSVNDRIVAYTAEDGTEFVFDSKEDLKEFEKKIGGKVSDYITISEYDDMSDEVSESELDRRMDFSRNALKEYRKYNRSKSRMYPVSYLLENPEKFNLRDFINAVTLYDSNASIYDNGTPTKESLIETLESLYNEASDEYSHDEFFSSKTWARVPNGESANTKTIDMTNTVYEMYANIKNPYIVDNGGMRAESKWSKYYEAVKYAEENGYDGAIIRNVEVGPGGSGAGTVVVAFNPNQVKSVNNTSPSNHNDIRYSDRDSKGNALTDEQKEYFKNSKARDSEGNLKYLYHGTESAGFTVFDSNESDDGISFYFTDSEDTANSYSGSEIGVSFSGNEFGSIDKFNEFLDAMAVDQWADERYHVFKDGSDYVLKVGEMALDEEGESILDEEDNYVYDFSEEVYRAGSLEEILDNLYSATNYTISPKANYGVYLNLENPLIVECNGNKWDELPSLDENDQWTTREYADYAKDSGYDGVIFNNVIDNGANTSYNKESSVYVAFDSNHIKSAENTSPTSDDDIRYQFRGLNKDGIEVYETSESTLNMTWNQRIYAFKKMIEEDYIGRTARFERNGHVYYARLDNSFSGKTLYGDKNFSDVGKRAYIKSGTDGDLFDLVENSKYDGSKADTKNHKKSDKFTDYFDYFVKDVQIDGKVYHLNATVKRKKGENSGYTYTLFLKENKNKKASPAVTTNGDFKGAGDASEKRVPQTGMNVNDNSSMSSYRSGSSNRTSLANALESVARTDLDRKILSEYKELAERLDSQEIDLSGVRKEMTEARKNGDKVLLASLNQRKEFLQDAILRGDRKLTKLHATKPIRNMIEIEREKSYNEAIVNNKAFNQRVRDRHNDSLLRGKIKDTMHELNDYLLHGNNKKHIMIGLQKTVAEALKSIDLEHPNSGEKTLAKLEGLRNAYDKIMDSDDPMMQNVWDQNVSDVIKAVSEEVSDTPLYRMNTQQLNDVKYMFDMILHTIRNANRSFMTAKNENIYERVERAKSELDWNTQRLARIAGTGWLRKMAWGDLKPYYAFKFLGSETIQEAFENVRKGEETYANDVAETKEFFRDTAEKYNLYQYDMDERHEFKTDTGEKFSLNLSQMMSVYAYSKRPQAKAHLEVGGIVLNEDNTFKQKVGKINVKMENVNTKAYKLSDDTIKSITDAMDKNLKDYVDDMVRYLSFVMGNKGNEVSLAMYGVKQFTEDYYFPISSSDIYMAKVSDQKMLTEINPVLKNAGFTKDLVKNANNPITVKGFNETWAKHAVEMSNYHALTLPLEDLTRIINWNSKSKEGYDEGIVAKITNTHSREAVDYVKNFIRDVNGGARSDYYSGISNKLTSLFKKGATFASLSVTIQQPSAIGRAMAIIEPKYFVGGKVDKMKHSDKWDLIKKYAPVAIIKEMGYFDTNMGRTAAEYILKRDYQKGERAKAFIEDSGYRDDVFSVGASLADEYTWSAMWDACSRKISAETNLKSGSNEFYEAVGDLFTKVIERTQVYDSVMSRSGLMRSKSDVVKMATSFMAEPTTSLNMLADAVMSAKEKDFASAKRKIGAVTSSLILNSILVSFVYAARDDDKDKTYTEKYIKELVENTKDSFNVASMIPYLRDIVSICQGYDVERTDMSVISDIVKSWQRLQSKSISPYKKVENFAGSIAQAFGLPLKNIMRDVRGMYNVVTSPFRGNNIIADDITDAITSGITGKDEKKYDDWIEAVKTGKNIRTVLKRYETRGVEKSTLASQITSNFKQTYRNASNAERAAMKGYLLNAYELLGYDRAKKIKDIDKWLDD